MSRESRVAEGYENSLLGTPISRHHAPVRVGCLVAPKRQKGVHKQHLLCDIMRRVCLWITAREGCARKYLIRNDNQAVVRITLIMSNCG